MADRPILFTLTRVQALLASRVTQPNYHGGSELPMPKYEYQKPHISSESQPYLPPANREDDGDDDQS